VVSNNFYGATALAIWFPVLVWAVWLAEWDHRVWLRAAAIAVLAYGLTALWLTPSYVRVTIENLKLVSEPGNNWSRAAAVAFAAALGAITWRVAKGRPGRAWPVFVWGSLACFSLNVLGNHFFRFRVAGEPLRLVPELDLAIILAVVEVVRWLWRLRPRLRFGLGWIPRAAAVLIVASSAHFARHYVFHAWDPFVRDWDFDRRIEYRITDWMTKNMPGTRALATGSVRFWYNAWHDLPQVGGGSEQGLLNHVVVPAQWQITMGDDPEPSIQWLQCLGAGAVIVHDKESEEIYHDFVHPKKFDGKLEAAWDDGKGNRIYRVPRRWEAPVRVVDRARAAALKSPAEGNERPALAACVDLVERGPEAAVEYRRESPSVMRMRARLEPGQSLLVQESYDPYWRAYSGGRRLEVRRNALGFMLIDAPPGNHDIRLAFETPMENLAGRVLTGISGLVILILFGLGWRGRREARA
jgi:hypothetical protein